MLVSFSLKGTLKAMERETSTFHLSCLQDMLGNAGAEFMGVDNQCLT